ncbi:MAG TPA: hypothetical protein VL283_01205 [Candidatus Baltobacteraceae bacterium]|nr:hypothetical protein [Candidatus Baltobacteraceae bacterium]
MMIAIRNATGIDLFLAISTSKKAIRLRITSAPPVLEEGEQAERLRAGEAHGIVNCPDGIRVKVDVSKAGLAIRVSKRSEVLDGVDEDGTPDGRTETFHAFTLRLMN